jgi:hypothetical protein
MVQIPVERAIQNLERRNVDEKPAARGKDLIGIPDRALIILNVFQHIDTGHGIEPLVAEFEHVAAAGVISVERNIREVNPHVVKVKLRHINTTQVSEVLQIQCQIADSATDFENSLPNVWGQKVNDPEVIVVRERECAKRLFGSVDCPLVSA